MDSALKQRLIDYLRKFATEDRWTTINNVLDCRTRHITVVLEDIYQPHNASAVLRSCECLGIQDVHVIENQHDFDPSKGVTIGADQWLTLWNYNEGNTNNTALCFNQLRSEGYRIIATTPHTGDALINDFPVEDRIALVFGAELTGISDYVRNHADGFVRIPMVGFSESYNISVSAALCIYELSVRLRKSKVNWQMSEGEIADLQLAWLEQSIRASDQLKKKFLQEQDSGLI